jgi:hypothetical protein
MKTAQTFSILIWANKARITSGGEIALILFWCL